MRLFLTAAESVEMSAHKRSNPDQKQAVLKRKRALERKGWLLDRENTIFNAEAREAVSRSQTSWQTTPKKSGKTKSPSSRCEGLKKQEKIVETVNNLEVGESFTFKDMNEYLAIEFAIKQYDHKKFTYHVDGKCSIQRIK